MSTRGALAVADGDAWRGRYLHWGHPDDVLPVLAALVRRDGWARVAEVLTEQRAGWSLLDARQVLGLDPTRHDARHVAVVGYGIAYTDTPADEWLTPWDTYDADHAYVLGPWGVRVEDLPPRPRS